MRISNSFKHAIRSTFYDKEITLYEWIIETDDEGGKKKNLQQTINTARVNLNFNALDQTQKDMGLAETIDARITAEPGTLNYGDVFEYDGHLFEVVAARPHDSHQEAAAVRYGKR